MKETVLYYTPQPTKQSRTLKGILVRMGIRIRNISPQQVNQTVGMLAGVSGFEEKTDATADTLEANKTNADALSGADPAADTVKASSSQSIPEEVLVLHQFSEQRLDALLHALRKANVRIALKAIVTEQNCGLTFYQLYEEIRQEHEKMHQNGEPN